MKYKNDRTQVFNPKSKHWVKIDIKNGRVIGHKNTPWKNIKKSKKPELITMRYELSNKPINGTLRVFRNKKELKLGKHFTLDVKNRYITIL